VLIQVAYSSLNFNDAMAAQGHPGIVRRFPHVPGIDAAGTVVASESTEFNLGAHVIATGHELGVGRLGGWAVGRLGGWAVGRLGGWAVGRLGGWAVGRSMSACRPPGRCRCRNR